MYNEGISRSGEILDMGVEAGIIDKSGAWYSYGDERIGQGRENAKQFLKENTDTLEAIRERLLEQKGLMLGRRASAGDDEEPAFDSGE